MLRSNLSVKVGIAEIVERLNDDECVDVVRLLQHELGYKRLNTMVHQIIMQFTQSLTHDSLIKIEKTIKDKYNHPFTAEKTKIKNNNKTTKQSVLFPLFRLPNDLILKISLFLNEKDIFQFEQCCRLFYKMINNTSYLNKCNNFKQFRITKRRLNQMKQDKYSFFKYSKAIWSRHYMKEHEYLYRPETCMVTCVNDFESTINQMQQMASYDNWWTSLLKSISMLDLSSFTNIGILLSVMPIDILFNPYPSESHLKEIILRHCVESGYVQTWNRYMNKFEQEYLDYEEKCEKQGLRIKSLECIKHMQVSDTPTATVHPRYINSKHVYLEKMKVDLTNDKFLTNKCNPGMKILSIKTSTDFVVMSNYEKDKMMYDYNSGNIIINRGLEIETMRLLSFRNCSNYDMCNKKVVIDSLNLQNSLKNLTMEFKEEIGPYYKQYDAEIKTLQTVFEKKYYYNLENVNIIVETGIDQSVDWFFKLLKKNQKILKYQFKQLNIAILKNIQYQQQTYFVFEWDKKIDDKYLDQAKNQFYQMNHDDYDQHQKQFKDKYLLMQTQWLDYWYLDVINGT